MSGHVAEASFRKTISFLINTWIGIGYEVAERGLAVSERERETETERERVRGRADGN